MADWDRKQLLSISYAIQRCLESGKLTTHQSDALAKIFEMTREGTRNVLVSSATVEKVKQALCEVCSTEKLYNCHKKVVCTGDCDFYKANDR